MVCCVFQAVVNCTLEVVICVFWELKEVCEDTDLKV